MGIEEQVAQALPAPQKAILRVLNGMNTGNREIGIVDFCNTLREQEGRYWVFEGQETFPVTLEYDLRVLSERGFLQYQDQKSPVYVKQLPLGMILVQYFGTESTAKNQI